MKTQQKKSLKDIMGHARHSEMETQNENNSEMTKLFGDILTSDYPDAEKVAIEKSKQRAMELSRRGIFACPRFSNFFADSDEPKMV